ncbi:protein TIC 20-v [Citrus sinensis]|nr:protein TIC 20-v [Citrus sinensis]
MTISNLLHSPQTPLTLLHKPHNHHTRSSFLKSPSSSSFFTLTNKVNHHQTITTKSKKSDSADYPDRLISAICYFYPFFDGIQYGKYVITQFTPIQLLIQPLIPAIKVFKSFPFNGFLVFLTLYFVVVRNTNFSRYVRFNTMQAIVLDVLLIFPDLFERTFNAGEGIGLDLMMSLDSTVFLFLLVCLIYGSSSCMLGQVPRLPIVAEAADRQALPIDAGEKQLTGDAAKLWLDDLQELAYDAEDILGELATEALGLQTDKRKLEQQVT